MSERTWRPVGERTGRLVRPSGQELNVEHAQIRTLLDRRKEQILAECQAEIKKHELQANYDRRSVQKLSEIVESQQEELHCAQAEEVQRRDQQLLHAQLLQQNSELREAHNKSLNEMEELKKFQSSTFDTNARRRLVEDQDTILELTGKIQELQNEINCMNDSRDIQDAESVRSGQSHVASRPVSFPPHPIPEGMLSRSIGMPSRREGPPSIWDTHGISGKVFANPVASSSAPYPQELNPWSSIRAEPIHSSAVEKSERQTQDQDQRCEQLLEQIRDLPEAHEKSLNEMEELKRFQGSTFGTISMRKLIEDRDTILELTGKIQELQNEINCMNDSRDFQDAESLRSGQSHVTSQPVFFPPHPNPGGMLSRSLVMPSRNNGPPSMTRMIYR